MIGALLGLVEALRANGVRVSTAEVLDGARAMTAIPLDDPAIGKAALAATLIKRSSDQPIFDELWQLLIEHRLGGPDGDEAPLVAALRLAGFDEATRERILALLADEASRLSPVVRGLIGLRGDSLQSLLVLGGLAAQADRLASALQAGFFTQQLWAQLSAPLAGLSALQARLDQLLTADEAARVRSALQQELQRRRRELREHVDAQLEARQRAALAVDRDQPLHRPFGALAESELGVLRRELLRLAAKLRSIARLRRSRRREGRLDVARTIRRALATGGVPMRLYRRKRRRQRPRLVVLCDVSDSVRHTTRFMLELTYSLQDLFDEVRSYVFVADVADVTDLFRHAALDRAVDQAVRGAHVNIFANSNYGRVFTRFAQRHLEHVTSRTTVIVLGDGRNNYHPDEAWALLRIKERCERLIWLTPEPESSWGFGDSAMRAYEPLCNRVEYVSDLASLVKAVDHLVEPGVQSMRRL